MPSGYCAGLSGRRSLVDALVCPSDRHSQSGALVINADDWGRDRDTTDHTLECIRAGSVSSVSAMVFMEDSEGAAARAREQGIDAGLHLNFTTAFSTVGTAMLLKEHQQRLSHYLRRHRFAQVVFHPGLTRSFEYVVNVQLDEFSRLYGTAPDRIDGHHHMHLCANVVLGKLLPGGTVVRRNFSFRRLRISGPCSMALNELCLRSSSSFGAAINYND